VNRELGVIQRFCAGLRGDHPPAKLFVTHDMLLDGGTRT
jgi:hypothetical protein